MKPSPSQVIFQTPLVQDKIYVKPQSGFFHSLRTRLNWILMLLFVALPLIQFEGNQAIHFDVAKQQFHLFSLTLFPQDFMALVFVFIVAAFLLFYVSAKWGRVWCGFTCPQTVWTAMFMWMENQIEGNRQQRMKLDKQKHSMAKIGKRLLKHLSWMAIALLTASVFMSYFVPAMALYPSLLNGSASPIVLGWVVFFALCTYVNAGLIREKMCQHMCPYARFQSVMVGPATKVVTYDASRGENRGPRKMKQAKPQGMGDCVDCDLCVQVCPVGIDIREGYQADCINCGLCIDACDQTMEKFGYPKRLIAFASEVANKPTLKSFGYFAAALCFVVLSLLWSADRATLEMTVIKDRNLMYRTLEDGRIENLYVLEVLNKSHDSAVLELAISDLELAIADPQPLKLEALEAKTVAVRVVSKAPLQTRFRQFELRLQEQGADNSITRVGTFMAPPQ